MPPLASPKRFFVILALFMLTYLMSFLPENLSTAKFPRVDESAEYRQLLSTVRPLDSVPHSKTLGVASRLYVIGLPGREDRHRSMQSLEKAMDITFTWHNATDMHSPMINEIQQRIHFTRAQGRKWREAEFPNPDSFPVAFADDVMSDDFLRPGDISGSELWLLPPTSPLALPPIIDRIPDDVVGNGLRAITEIACWQSHFDVLRKIADGDDDVAIIFEDDIDMEWDLERRLRSLWPILPEKWDLVMIGHCLGREYEKEPLPGTSYLYPSTDALCTHAYAVSKKSATRLVRFLRSPLYAYYLPIDEVYVALSHEKRLESFSVYPPAVIQTSTTPSDVSGGMGILTQFNDRQFALMDSALDRVRLWEVTKEVQNSTSNDLRTVEASKVR